MLGVRLVSNGFGPTHSGGERLLGCRVLSAPGVILDSMRVTETDIARVPVGNLRVPRAEFGAVWAAAERLKRRNPSRVSGA